MNFWIYPPEILFKYIMFIPWSIHYTYHTMHILYYTYHSINIKACLHWIREPHDPTTTLSFRFDIPIRSLLFFFTPSTIRSNQFLINEDPTPIRIPFTTLHSKFQALIFLSMISFSFKPSYTTPYPMWYPNFVFIKILRYVGGSQWTYVKVNPLQCPMLWVIW